MKKSNKIIMGSIAITIIVIIISMIIAMKYKNKEQERENEKTQQTLDEINEEYEQAMENSEMYNENASIETLKEEYKMTGEDNIYEVTEEADGRKVLTVKSDLNFKVAFAGMIKNNMPQKEELDSIYEQNFPQKAGIYVDAKDRDKILQYLNNNQYLNNKYHINSSGFIEIKEKNNETENDKKMEKVINGNKTYVISINVICYMMDAVTGEIVDNPYRKMEEDQMYEYFQDDEKIILFITDSKNMPQDEIFNVIINFDNY